MVSIHPSITVYLSDKIYSMQHTLVASVTKINRRGHRQTGAALAREVQGSGPPALVRETCEIDAHNEEKVSQ